MKKIILFLEVMGVRLAPTFLVKKEEESFRNLTLSCYGCDDSYKYIKDGIKARLDELIADVEEKYSVIPDSVVLADITEYYSISEVQENKIQP